MKKCPVCGAKNSRHSLICGDCGASFESAQEQPQTSGAAVSGPETATPYRPAVGGPDSVTAYRPAVGGPDSIQNNPLQTGGPLGGVNQQGDEPLTMVGQPLNAQASNQQVNGGPQTDAYGTVAAPPKIRYRENPDLAPVKYSVLRSSVGSILMLLILLGGGWYSYQRFVVKPRPVLESARTFIEASSMNDWQKMQGTLDQNSVILLNKVYKNMMTRRTPAGVDFFAVNGQEFSEGKQYKLKVMTMTETTSQVRVSPGPAPIYVFKSGELPPKYKDGFLINLTNVNGEWKINLVQFTADLASCGHPYSSMTQYFVSRGY